MQPPGWTLSAAQLAVWDTLGIYEGEMYVKYGRQKLFLATYFPTVTSAEWAAINIQREAQRTRALAAGAAIQAGQAIHDRPITPGPTAPVTVITPKPAREAPVFDPRPIKTPVQAALSGLPGTGVSGPSGAGAIAGLGGIALILIVAMALKKK